MFTHGTASGYKNGCRCPVCTAAQTAEVRKIRQRRRKARVEIEARLAARLRSAVYHDEPWVAKPKGMSAATWRNELRATIARLDKGNVTVKKALDGEKAA